MFTGGMWQPKGPAMTRQK